METSPSQSSGQGGGVWWSVQTGHPTAVTDGFHQGAHGLTGEMYMETAAKGADIYLPAALMARTQEAKMKSLVRKHISVALLLSNSCVHCTNLWLRANAK